jgi:hypothetical protein
MTVSDTDKHETIGRPKKIRYNKKGELHVEGHSGGLTPFLEHDKLSSSTD